MQPAKSKTLFAEIPMYGATKNSQSKLKQAQHHVFNELLKRGVLPHRAAGGHLRANTPMGRRLELRVATSTGNAGYGKQRFSVPDFHPRPELIFLCVEFARGEIETVWVIPSTVLFVYSNPGKKGRRELNLDAPQSINDGHIRQNRDDTETLPLREYGSCFRNRWEPVAQFDTYRRFMKPWDSPAFADGWENFEDEMMALEAIENREPRSESIPISEIKFSGAAALAS